MKRKLASRRGETLTETLVGILIVGLSTAALACMAAVSARANSTAVREDAALYEAVTEAEAEKTPIGDTTVTVTVDGVPHEFPSVLYGSGDVPLYAYRREGPP